MTVERVKELFSEAVTATQGAKETISEVGESTLLNLFNYMLQVAVQEEQERRVTPAGGSINKGGLSLV